MGEDIEIELEAGSNGVFDVRVAAKLIYSKAKTGRFPSYQEIPKLIADES